MAKPTERKSKKNPGKGPPKRRGRALSSENGAGRNSAKRGPRLPSALRKELDRLNPERAGSGDEVSSGEEVGDVSARGDVYEYDESVAEEESKKNRRFDSVDNLEYELPDDFEDENVSSDMEDDDGSDNELDDSDKLEAEDLEKDERHARMLHDITGMPTEAFQDKGGGMLRLMQLQKLKMTMKLRLVLLQLENGSLALHAPLPKSERERLERKAAYEQSKKDITNWEPLVKRNREAPTVFFDEDIDVCYSAVGAIASEFEPRAQFEQKISSLLCDSEIAEAREKRGARLLELNVVTVEDVKDCQNRLAKLRNLLFQHEIKAKRIKKIKFKTYRRLLRKDKSKEASDDLDSEAVRDLRIKQEFKRAEERMRLKHKNTSK